MGHRETKPAAGSRQRAGKRGRRSEVGDQRTESRFRIADFKKTEDRDFSVGAAFSRDLAILAT